MPPDVSIRALTEEDLAAADEAFRLAFGTFLGMPEPLRFFEGAELVRSRWRADPDAAFAAEVDGEVVGSNFATSWGSVGFFGPLTVRPDRQERGIGKALMGPIVECFERWGIEHAGLFTFAESPKHVGLYRRFGFYPRFLTAIMAKPIAADGAGRATRWSDLSAGERASALAECRELTDAVHPGLDVTREIDAVDSQGIGDVLLLGDDGALSGIAVLHVGEGSEAMKGTGFVKFAALRPGPGADDRLDKLLEACEQTAAERGAGRLDAGTNLAREETYRVLLRRGYRAALHGVAMHRPNEPGYNRPGVYVIDDWR
jgi:GNAT superfamily N-acetyltransferase